MFISHQLGNLMNEGQFTLGLGAVCITTRHRITLSGCVGAAGQPCERESIMLPKKNPADFSFFSGGAVVEIFFCRTIAIP